MSPDFEMVPSIGSHEIEKPGVLRLCSTKGNISPLPRRIGSPGIITIASSVQKLTIRFTSPLFTEADQARLVSISAPTSPLLGRFSPQPDRLPADAAHRMATWMGPIPFMADPPFRRTTDWIRSLGRAVCDSNGKAHLVDDSIRHGKVER